MHEFGIARDLVRQALAEAENCGASRITALHIGVGATEAIDWDTLLFSIRAAAVDTLAQGVTVEIRKEPGTGVILESIEVEEQV